MILTKKKLNLIVLVLKGKWPEKKFFNKKRWKQKITFEQYY